MPVLPKIANANLSVATPWSVSHATYANKGVAIATGIERSALLSVLATSPFWGRT
jgi:hypothetical protein